jgi:SAM-dependent methyltransferase
MGEIVDVIDKTGVLARLANGERVAVELGCGPRKRQQHAVGIDQLDYPAVDLVGDVFTVLAAMPDGSVQAVYTYHFLEHVHDLSLLLSELARVLQPGGKLEIEVPHFSNPYFYSDPTHVRAFGLYTFSYLAEEKFFKRKVPMYGRTPDFALDDVKLQFDSPFIGRKIIRRLIGPLFNAGRWMQEFHEENLCYLFSAYQIRFVLRRLDDRPLVPAKD